MDTAIPEKDILDYAEKDGVAFYLLRPHRLLTRFKGVLLLLSSLDNVGSLTGLAARVLA